MLTVDVMSDPCVTHFRATQAAPFSAESVFPDPRLAKFVHLLLTLSMLDVVPSRHHQSSQCGA